VTGAVTDANGATSYTTTVPAGTTPSTDSITFSGGKAYYTGIATVGRYVTVPPP